MKNDPLRKDTAKHFRAVHNAMINHDSEFKKTWIKEALIVVCLSLLVFLMSFFCSCAYSDTLKIKAYKLQASWYSVESLKKEGTWKNSKGVMANGKQFKDEGLTCATRLWSIGTILRVTNRKTKKSVDVTVTDKIGKRFATTRIDLSKEAFKKIADLKEGVIKVFVVQLKGA